MKAEERHELEKNDLESGMVRLWVWLQKYGSHVLLGVAVAILAFQGWRWWQGEQMRKEQMATNELTDAAGGIQGAGEKDPAKLRSIALQYDIRPVQALAWKHLGDYYADILTMGTPIGKESKISPEMAQQEGMEAYQKVIRDFADQKLPVMQAHLGLGRMYENARQWEKAKGEYETVVKNWGETAFAAEAQRRLDKLGEWSKPVAFVPAAASQPAVEPTTRP